MCVCVMRDVWGDSVAAAGAYDCLRVHVELLGDDGGDACVAVQVGRAANVTNRILFQFQSSIQFIIH